MEVTAVIMVERTHSSMYTRPDATRHIDALLQKRLLQHPRHHRLFQLQLQLLEEEGRLPSPLQVVLAPITPKLKVQLTPNSKKSASK